MFGAYVAGVFPNSHGAATGSARANRPGTPLDRARAGSHATGRRGRQLLRMVSSSSRPPANVILFRVLMMERASGGPFFSGLRARCVEDRQRSGRAAFWRRAGTHPGRGRAPARAGTRPKGALVGALPPDVDVGTISTGVLHCEAYFTGLIRNLNPKVAILGPTMLSEASSRNSSPSRPATARITSPTTPERPAPSSMSMANSAAACRREQARFPQVSASKNPELNLAKPDTFGGVRGAKVAANFIAPAGRAAADRRVEKMARTGGSAFCRGLRDRPIFSWAFGKKPEKISCNNIAYFPCKATEQN